MPLITAALVGDPPETVMLIRYADAVAPVPSPPIVTVGASRYLLPFSEMYSCSRAPLYTLADPVALTPFCGR